MDIFGVGPIEIIIILVLGLIVFGPERLPEVGRFLGKQLAKVMAWQQQSPEAQMIQQIRQDFEKEIVDLRDELVRARQQIDVSQDMQRLRTEANSLFSLKTPPQAVATNGDSPADAASIAGETPPTPTLDDLRQPAASLPNKLETDLATSDELAEAALKMVDSPEPTIAPPELLNQLDELPTIELPQLHPTTNGADSNGTGHMLHEYGVAGPAVPELAEMQQQLNMLMAELHRLQEQLRARGLLDSPAPALREEEVISQ
jgi:sec-independent protein translocase protein TatB